jgi:hypothetical protein
MCVCLDTGMKAASLSFDFSRRMVAGEEVFASELCREFGGDLWRKDVPDSSSELGD